MSDGGEDTRRCRSCGDRERDLVDDACAVCWRNTARAYVDAYKRNEAELADMRDERDRCERRMLDLEGRIEVVRAAIEPAPFGTVWDGTVCRL